MVDPAVTPRLAELAATLGGRYRFFKGVVERSAQTFGPAWAAEFEDTLTHLFPTTESLEKATDGYAKFVMDLLRRQRQFEKDLDYPAKTYAEAASEVYADEAYMLAQYLPGLLVAHFLWPHHQQHGKFFDAAFVDPMRLQEAPRFVEVGIGTGLYSRRVLTEIPDATGTGYDISPASHRFAQDHLRAYGLEDRYAVELRDVVAEPMEPCEWIVCIEVLEHLEDPVTFLRALKGSLAPGGKAFVTAALNAAHVDHIYLYRTVEDVLANIRDAGFDVEQGFFGNAHRPTKPGLPVPSVAAFVVQ